MRAVIIASLRGDGVHWAVAEEFFSLLGEDEWVLWTQGVGCGVHSVDDREMMRKARQECWARGRGAAAVKDAWSNGDRRQKALARGAIFAACWHGTAEAAAHAGQFSDEEWDALCQGCAPELRELLEDARVEAELGRLGDGEVLKAYEAAAGRRRAALRRWMTGRPGRARMRGIWSLMTECGSAKLLQLIISIKIHSFPKELSWL